MWWGGFSEGFNPLDGDYADKVLIPMWWGGFSEENKNVSINYMICLNPHVVGRFFREVSMQEFQAIWSLNPHVVGRFFRDALVLDFVQALRS